MSAIDEFPFPFQKPVAQELLRVLAALYRTEREAMLFTQPLGVDPLTIAPGLDAISLWFDLLSKLAALGAVRPAVQAARDQFPRNPRAAFLDSLLIDQPVPTSAEPLSERGPTFDDRVTEPEALLFFDDLTMPVGRVANLISTLKKVVALAPAVCLLKVETMGASFFGTGFRASERLVLTNHHVLFPRDVLATSVRAEFGFDVDQSGASMTVTSLAGVSSTIRGDKADDWAIVEVPDMAADWPIVALDDAPPPKVGDAAFILQHPGGQQKRLGYVRNLISDVDDGLIRYLTDTQPGSSGSPVFDSQARLIGLHHAGGRAIEVAGRPPIAKNEGIRISRVLQRLADNGINLRKA